jgi:hypothetical protein
MKSFLSHVIVFFMAALIGVGSTVYWFGQRDRSHTFESTLPSLFSDFQMVAESNEDWYIPKHTENGKPFPARLDAGRTYILHHQPALSDAEVFEKTIKLMRSKGVNISDADDGSRIRKDGLAFRISFEDGVYAGYLQRWLSQNDPDARPEDKCKFPDYVLVITQARLAQRAT